jgi:hypothetical protein
MSRMDYTPASYHSRQAANVETGPAMAELNPRQQAVVWYLLDTGDDNWTRACQQAGYTGTYESIKVTASRLRQNPKMGMAIQEMSARMPNVNSAMAMKTLLQIAGDPSHKDAAKVALALARMAGITEVNKSEKRVVHAHEDPLARIELNLAKLPPDIAARLRAELLPHIEAATTYPMIDVTPEAAVVPARSDASEGSDDPIAAFLQKIG